MLRNTAGDLGIKTDVSLQLGSVKSHLTIDKMPRTQAESMLIWRQNENKINKPDIKLGCLESRSLNMAEALKLLNHHQEFLH